jgi:crotonobetainyl-CoA:carnitine CoA-transferase CaiB-like acyl-CoA transferase
MQLADMGARVIKIEGKEGDDTRGFGPPFVEGESTYFMSINRGKESVVLDLKHPEGKALALRLAAQADILVENFRPGVAERLGLGYSALQALNPRLVYTSISGFGQAGLPEFSQLPGYDLVLQGLSGIPSLTGLPDGPPFKSGTSIADLVTGLYALQGILLALLARQQTGRGQQVDISMLDGQLSLLTYQAAIFFATGKSPLRRGNQHPSITPYETFRAQDGYLNVAVGNDAQYQKLCELLPEEPALREPRFVTNAGRVASRDALAALLEPRFAARPVSSWIEALNRAGIPAGPIAKVGEALAHPQALAREMVVERQHSKAGPVKMLGVPVRLSETPGQVGEAPPTLGQHTDAVLRERLGLSEDELSRLRRVGAIG